MSFEKRLEEKGVALTEDNTLPKGRRTQKDFKRVIAAIRAAEAASNDELRDANERCRAAQSQVILLQGKLQQLAAENARLKLQRTLDDEGFAQLTVSDKSKLLELAPA